MNREYFQADISRRIWDTKYRFRERDEIRDQTVEDSWRRVAHALASVETSAQVEWEQRFYNVLEGLNSCPVGASRPAPVPATASRCSIVS